LPFAFSLAVLPPLPLAALSFAIALVLLKIISPAHVAANHHTKVVH
jgi:hypothetical protein